MLEVFNRFEIAFYIGLGLLALYFVRMLWSAQQNAKFATYPIEREIIRRDTIRALTGLVVVLSLSVAVYFLNRAQQAPAVPPPPTFTPTATLTLLLLPTATRTLTVSPTPSPTFTVAPTATPGLSPTPDNSATSTPIVEPAVIIPPTATQDPRLGQPPDCPNPDAQITQPGDSARVTEIIQIRGNAAIENFDYYKFEFRFMGGPWNYIQHANIAVRNGVLGTWNTDTVPPGEYELRLVVVDATGNYPSPCVVRLIVE